MVPERLSLRNFMCYREDLPPLEFEGLHIACLSGDNGAGKSALLDAITWALWGRARLNSDDELIASGAQEMEVDLQFALNGQSYRVIRKRNRSKRGQSWLDFQGRNSEGWKALTEATLRETQQAISQLLRIDYDTFINSAFLLQGRADEFTSRKKPAERKQILGEILGLTQYDQLQQAAKEKASGFEKLAIGKETLIVELSRRADGQPKYRELLDEAAARVAVCEQELARSEQLRGEVVERRRVLSAQRDMLREAQQQLKQLAAELTQLQQERAELAARIVAAEALQARRAEIQAGMQQIEDAEHELARLDALLPEYEALIERRRSAEACLAEDERVLRTEIQLARSTLQGLEQLGQEREHTTARIVKGEAFLAGQAPLVAELEQLRQQRISLSRQEGVSRELEQQRRAIEQRIKLRFNSLIASREEAQRMVRRLEVRLADQPSWQKQYDAAHRAAAELDALLDMIEQQRASEATAVEAIGALRAEDKRIEQAGREIVDKLKLLDHDAATCPLCSNDLGHEGVDRIRTLYEQERKSLREQLRSLRQQIAEHDKALQQLRDSLATAEQRATQLRHSAAQAQSLEQRLGEAARDRDELRQQREALQSILDQLERETYAEPEQQELRLVEAGLVEAGGDSLVLRQQLEQVNERSGELERQTTRFARALGELEALKEKLVDIDTRLANLPASSALVAQLEQRLAAGDFGQEARRAIAHVDAELIVLGYSRPDHEQARRSTRELRPWRDEAHKLQQADALSGELRSQQLRGEESLQRRSSERAALDLRIGQLAAAAQELGAVERREQELENQLAAQRRQRDVALSDHGQYQQRLEDAERAAQQLVVERLALAELRCHQETYEELAQCFGKKGVQAMLIETAIPEIEHEANRLLARMTDNQMHLTFETQRDTKKGDTIETLEIKIADALGTRAYEAFSGGESFRVNFAIRVALARLLARRTGANLETLVIDEGFGTQDARGRERLVDAITSVQHDFRRILVVTHIQELKDLFPAQIEITKTDTGSVWSIG